jgi:hypothetical protein
MSRSTALLIAALLALSALLIGCADTGAGSGNRPLKQQEKLGE